MLSCHRMSAFSSRSMWLNSPIWVYWGHRDSYCLATSRWTPPLTFIAPSDPGSDRQLSVPGLVLHPSGDKPMYFFLLSSNICFFF